MENQIDLDKVFHDVSNEMRDLLDSCLPRTKRFYRRLDQLLAEQSFLLNAVMQERLLSMKPLDEFIASLHTP